MKRIFFWNKNIGSTPFWQPWGCLGCLGRVIGFLLLLLALLFLLSLFRKCEDTNPYERGGSDPIADNWNRPIENGEDDYAGYNIIATNATGTYTYRNGDAESAKALLDRFSGETVIEIPTLTESSAGLVKK